MGSVYLQRTGSPIRRRLLGWRRTPRYELWRDGVRVTASCSQLNRLLDARRFPADFWVTVHAVDAAHAWGDTDSWIEWATGRRVPDPPD